MARVCGYLGVELNSIGCSLEEAARKGMVPLTLTREQVETEAERLLLAAWRDDERRLLLPVDPAQIARRFGIKVYEVPMEPDVAAMLIKEAGRDPAIVLNSADSKNRKRFSCAHELGHFVRKSEEQYEYVDRRNDLSAAGTDPEEVFANQFGAGLLMPASEVQRLKKARLKPYEMALKFGVSVEAITYRLQNLGML